MTDLDHLGKMEFVDIKPYPILDESGYNYCRF